MILLRRLLLWLFVFGLLAAVGYLVINFDEQSVAIENAPPILAANQDHSSGEGLSSPANSRQKQSPMDREEANGSDSYKNWLCYLAKLREIPIEKRKQCLESQTAFLNCELLHDLLSGSNDPLFVEWAIEALYTEEDPLIQAVLLNFIGLQVRDERVIPVLEKASRELIQDVSRITQAQIAVDGLMNVMGFQKKDPHQIFRHIAQEAKDDGILTNLWFGLHMHQFPYEMVQDLIWEGMLRKEKSARFGAAESLRFFAQENALSAAQFLELFSPFILQEADPHNRMFFLESLGAIGKELATPYFKRYIAEANDPEVITYSATAYAVYGNPNEALAFFRDLVRNEDPKYWHAAISALGAMPSEEAVKELKELYFQKISPEQRHLVLQSLRGKVGDHYALFQEAAFSQESSLRLLASEEFLLGDKRYLSDLQKEAIQQWFVERMETDPNPQVRTNAMLGVIFQQKQNARQTLLHKMQTDSDVQVRGNAAVALYLLGWANNDKSLTQQVRDQLQNENFIVRSVFEKAIEPWKNSTPEDFRKAMEQNRRMWELVNGQGANPGQKDMAGMQLRFNEWVLDMLKQ